MKKFLTVLIGLLVLIVLPVFSKNLIAKALVENGVRLATGLSLRIEKLDFGLLTGEISIENLELLNPPGFPDRTMIQMPKIYLKVDTQDFFKGKIRLHEMNLFLKEFTVVKNQKGEINLNTLKAVSKKGKREKQSPKKGGPASEFGIERLELRVDRVVFKDYSRGAPPSVKEFNINLKESYERVPNLYFVTSLIVVKTMTRTTLAGFTNLDLSDLQGTVTDTLAASRRFASDAVARAERIETQLREAAGVTRSLAKKIKFPFGEDE